jgi:hypothetical protein
LTVNLEQRMSSVSKPNEQDDGLDARMVQKLIRSVVAVLRDRCIILASGIVASRWRSSFGE